MCLHGFSLLITSCCRQGIDHPEAIAVKRKFSLSIPLDPSVTTPSVPLGRTNSNKEKLETAQRSSLAVYNIGEPPLAPTPMASNTT